MNGADWAEWWVFSFHALHRAMPKRPCAIAFTGDDDMLLCADKFGDVYAIPLLIEASSLPSTDGPTAPAPKQPPPVSDKGKLAEAKRRRTEISHDLPFSNKLLLGHVSMLTDLVVVSSAPEGGGKMRKYILTADRDEHIRVSRYPQSYVIEGFCLGHKSFVSKLLIPSWDKSQLLSGGGDDFLLRWHWEQSRNTEAVSIARLIEDVVGKKVVTGKAEEEDGEFKPVLIGMWEVPSQQIVIAGFEAWVFPPYGRSGLPTRHDCHHFPPPFPLTPSFGGLMKCAWT